MGAEITPAGVHDPAGADGIGRPAGHEPRVVVVGNEADLLRVGLVEDGQAELLRDLANAWLAKVSDG